MDSNNVPLKDYDPAVYNALPDFPDVAKAFRAREGKFFIRDVRKVFLRHRLEENLGVGLVHAHFQLAENERLVQEDLRSTPWDIKDVKKGNVVSSSWVFQDGALYPYEFEVASQGSSYPELPQAFINDLYALLKANEYEKTLGITTIVQGQTVNEHTEGRTNILTLVEGSPRSDHTVPSNWSFSGSIDDDKDEGVEVRGNCRAGKCDWYHALWGMRAGKIQERYWPAPLYSPYRHTWSAKGVGMKANLEAGSTLVLAPNLRLTVGGLPAQAHAVFLHSAVILDAPPNLVGPYQCTSDEELKNVAGFWTGPHEVEPNVFQIDFEIDDSAITSGRIASNKKISMKKVKWDELTLKELDCANRQLNVGRNDWASHKDILELIDSYENQVDTARKAREEKTGLRR